MSRGSSAITVLVTAAALGCSGYSEGSGRAADASVIPAEPLPRPAEPDSGTPGPATDAGSKGKASAPSHNAPLDASSNTPSAPVEPPAIVDPPSQPSAPDKDSAANLRLARSARFDGYLSDAYGQALYMFAGDVAGVPDSACTGECARTWPPFDLSNPRPSSELAVEDIGRFHRRDGAWQATYKGHPLYTRASELWSRDVTSDGAEQRWFVARDYLVFLSTSRVFAPAGSSATDAPFLTDGYGRTLYVCLGDQPRTPESEAVSSCDAACTVKRPVFTTSQTERTTLLPSVIEPTELRELLRPDGQAQLTYRGWPLYQYSGDVNAGSTEGHNERAWRAIDPLSFGLPMELSD